MLYKFLTIPACDSASGQGEINAFCASHKIVSVEKHFVPVGVESFWAFCISYVDKNAGVETFTKKDKTDYRYVLNERDFAVYSRLRLLRKTLAERDGIPVYALFTNEQLATMVRNYVKTESDMLRINGIGKARVEKYGKEFLLLLCKEYDKEAAGEENKN